MAAARGRRRQQSRPRRRPIAILVVVGALVLSLTSVLGMLAARGGRAGGINADKGRRQALASLNGPKDQDLKPPAEIQEKLTFYHTLTAPPAAPPGTRAKSAGEPASRVETKAGAWTVQVAAYRSRNQADALQRSLAHAGYDAQVIPVPGENGAVLYRVWVGSYAGRSEAETVSQRLRAGTLVPFVLPR